MFKSKVHLVIRQNKEERLKVRRAEISLTLPNAANSSELASQEIPKRTPQNSATKQSASKSSIQAWKENDENSTDTTEAQKRSRKRHPSREKKPKAIWFVLKWVQRIGAFFITFVATVHQIVDTQGSLRSAQSEKTLPNTLAVDLKTYAEFPKPFGDVYIRLTDNRFGFVDATSWGIQEAHVVCRQQGYPNGAYAFSKYGLFRGENSVTIPPQVFVTSMKCNGDETNLNECTYKVTPKNALPTGVPRSLSSYKAEERQQLLARTGYSAAGALCAHPELSLTENQIIQLNHKSPLYMVDHEQELHYVCIKKQTLDANTLKLLCHGLGYEATETAYAIDVAALLSDNVKSSVTAINCDSSDLSLDTCETTIGSGCPTASILAVNCSATESHLSYDASCLRPNWRGDAHCDDVNNHQDCWFDGGDCCGASVDTSFCRTCACHEMGKSALNSSFTCDYFLFEDGVCDPVNDKEECALDGGDCIETQFGCKYFQYYMDGICDDENNVESCHFDGSDCCSADYWKKPVSYERCTLCQCLSRNMQLFLYAANDTFESLGEMHYGDVLFDNTNTAQPEMGKGFVRDEFFGIASASTICKSLGFAHGAKDYVKHFFFTNGVFPDSFGDASGIKTARVLNCPLDSTSVDRCDVNDVRLFKESSVKFYAAGVICALNESEACNDEHLSGNVELEFGHYGELTFTNRHGEHGYLCSLDFAIADLQSLCKIMDFVNPIAFATYSSQNARYDKFAGSYFMCDYSNYKNGLTHCSYQADYIDCPENKRVSLYCLDNFSETHYTFVAIDGSPDLKPSGMIQIVNNHRRLGAICSELNFGHNELKVACRHLGYSNWLGFTTQTVAADEIAIDYVFCTGSESSLYFCSYFYLGACESQQVVVVSCA